MQKHKERERSDTIEHFIDDIRLNNPRLMLLVAENPLSMEGRKLFKKIAETADVGFFEQPNSAKTTCGTEVSHAKCLRKINDDLMSLKPPSTILWDQILAGPRPQRFCR